MTQKVLFIVILLVLGAAAAVVFLELRPTEEGAGALVQGLKPGEGRQLVLTNCVPCHSTSLVVSYRASREGWDEVITRMQEEEGLWTFTPEDRTTLLDYLETTQGPVDSEEMVKVTPWAQPLYKPNPIW